ncbi:hypothetical protein BS47DRAFT_1266801, partial [Hydnum rufescens UP504]
CLEAFIRRFLSKSLTLSYCHTTRAAQKTPEDAASQGLDMFYRLCSAIMDHDIPPQLVLNYNQTQVVYAPGTQYTWDDHGSKQVSITGQDDKHAFTVTPAIAMSGNVLPFQSIYCG